MAKKLLICLFFTIGLISYAQDEQSSLQLVDVVIYEAESRSGGKFIGVAPDEFEAQIAIDELSFLKEGTKYHIVASDIHIMPVLIDKSTSIKEDFISEDDYLEFKYISEIELISLEYLEANDIKTAISFYKNVSREKNPAIVKKHLRKLQSNYSKYLFDHEPSSTLVNVNNSPIVDN